VRILDVDCNGDMAHSACSSKRPCDEPYCTGWSHGKDSFIRGPENCNITLRVLCLFVLLR
jgi:hypothetical protein